MATVAENAERDRELIGDFLRGITERAVEVLTVELDPDIRAKHSCIVEVVTCLTASLADRSLGTMDEVIQLGRRLRK